MRQPDSTNYHTTTTMMSRCLLALLFLTSSLRQCEAWSSSPLSISSSVSPTTRTQRRPFLVPTSATTTTTTLHAGFGGAGQQPQTSKEIKLKPKQQWDRYLGTLKKETPYKVAVRPVDSESWFVVGSVKSQGSDQTALAVARQRALIAEVRLCARVFVCVCMANVDSFGAVTVEHTYTNSQNRRISSSCGSQFVFYCCWIIENSTPRDSIHSKSYPKWLWNGGTQHRMIAMTGPRSTSWCSKTPPTD